VGGVKQKAITEMLPAVVCGLSDPAQPISEPSIAITSGLNASDRSFTNVPLSKVKAYLASHKECYERTMPTQEEPSRFFNRVYVDIDGELPVETSEEVFNKKHSEVLTALTEFCKKHDCSLMEASKWKCVNDKGETNNTLSYRITYKNLCGKKAWIKYFVESEVVKELNTLVGHIVPVKGVLSKNSAKVKAELASGSNLIIDLAVYNDGQRKMRMEGQSKPVQKRPNKIVLGSSIDCLITYIPPDCKVLPEPINIFKLDLGSAPTIIKEEENEDVDMSITITTGDPSEDDTNAKQLVADVLENLDQKRWDYYPDWIRIGFICYNEGFTFDEFCDLSKKSKHWRDDSSPQWVKSKWKQFRKSNLTQALLWKWLSEDNIDAYTELSANRRDFWILVKNANHAETARFFYNLKPDAYIFSEKLGWFQLLSNNIWKHYDQKPSGLLSDIWSSFKKIIHEHQSMIDLTERDEEKAKFQMARWKAIKSFASAIGNKTFCDGVIAFLPAMYNDDELHKKMDESRHLFAFTDAVYDLDADVVRPIKPEDWICLNTGYEFPHERSSEARDELVETIRSVFETQEDIEANDGLGDRTFYMLRTIALCLHGTRKYEKFYIWTGSGGNGKGLMSEIVKRTFGDYYHPIPHSCITKAQDKKDAPNPPIAKAKGKRFVQASEPEADDKLQVGVVKELSGGDEITARDMYRSTITFLPQFGLFIQTNTIPKMNRADGGAQRRIEVFPFQFNFKEEPTEPHHKLINVGLKDKICHSNLWRNEFFWLLLDCFKHTKANGLVAPDWVKEASQEYMDENNPVKGWLETTFHTTKDAQDRRFQIESSRLRAMYEESTNHKISPDKFKTSMMLCGVQIKKESHPFKTSRYDGLLECYKEAECGAGRYWCGLLKKDIPPP
jgi:P4 family phage/plasmid primase-like protien